ncbi:MAG: hypothetical protein IKJ11_05180 [Clostridia bacterium]|nr:hypothetical protein [Clostridia bacterium]
MPLENKPRRRAPAAASVTQEPAMQAPQAQESQAAPQRRRRMPSEPQAVQPPVTGRQDAPQAAPRQAPLPAPEQPPPPPPRQKKPAKKKKKKKNKTIWLILIIIILLLLLAALGVVVYKVNQQREFERYVFDTEAIEGRIQTMTEEEIQEELNRVVDEGMFNISIASSIVFDPKTKQGQARIENIAANHYHMQVDIFLNDTQELIYSSKLLRPGYSLEYIELDKQLAPGEYEATAVFSAITQQELQLFGQAGAEIRLYIMDENGRLPTPTPAPQSTAAP